MTKPQKTVETETTQEKPARRPLPQVKTKVKAGPARRMENFGDPIGNYTGTYTTY
jgi:hypothetical protein